MKSKKYFFITYRYKYTQLSKKALLSIVNKGNLYVFTEECYNQITKTLQTTKNISLIKIPSKGSKENWKKICSCVDEIYNKNKDIFQDIKINKNIKRKAICRYLSLSPIKEEVENLIYALKLLDNNNTYSVIFLTTFLDHSLISFLNNTQKLKFKIYTTRFSLLKNTKSFFKKELKTFLRKVKRFTHLSRTVINEILFEKDRVVIQKTINNIPRLRRIPKHKLTKPSLGSRNIKSDINFLFPDIRNNYINTKAKYLIPVIKYALNQNKFVRIIIPNISTPIVKQRVNDVFKDFIDSSNIEINFSPSKANLNSFLHKLRSFLKIIKKTTYYAIQANHKFNITVLMSRYKLHLHEYNRITALYPTNHWIGLLDSFALTLIKGIAPAPPHSFSVSAIQFGVADQTQLSYKYFASDFLFVSSNAAKETYITTKINSNIIISGNVEIEHTIRKHPYSKIYSNTPILNLVFFDQPILQRKEFDISFVNNTYNLLLTLSKIPNVSIMFKTHPRSNNEIIPFKQFNNHNIQIVRNSELSTLFLANDIAISFFSAALELALPAGCLPISIGGERIYTKQDIHSLTSNGGIVTENLDLVTSLVEQMANTKTLKKELLQKPLKFHYQYINSSNPSKIIIDTLLARYKN